METIPYVLVGNKADLIRDRINFISAIKKMTM